MTVIGKNIRKIRTVKGFSQAAFADIFNIKRGNISAYEEGRANPKTELIVEIANYFSIPVDQFLSKELTINDLTHLGKLDEEIITSSKKNIAYLNATEIYYISKDNLAIYQNNYNNKEYLFNLPKISFPFTSKKITLAFEVNDDKMKIIDNKIGNDDILLCRALNIENIQQIEENSIHLLHINNNFIVSKFKPGNDKKGELVKDSDENIYYINDIIEMYDITGVIKFNFATQNIMEKRISNLEDSIDKLNKYLKL